MKFLEFYTLVANRWEGRGGLENFPNINRLGGWKIFQILIAGGGGGGVQNFKLKVMKNAYF